MNTELRQSLLAELADIERQLQDPTLSNMDRDRLDQVWEDTHDRLDDLDGLFIAIPPIDDRVWRGASDFLSEYEGRTPTPPPSSPIRLAPSPPPVVLGRDALLPPFPPVPRTLSFHGISVAPPPPPLSSTNLLGLHPSLIEDQGVSAPSPPRPWEPSEEDIERANAWEDDRPDCSRCPGCHYCTGYGYDEADEF